MKTNYIKPIAILGIICTLTFARCQKDDILEVDTKEIVLSPSVKEVTFNLTVNKNGEWRIEHLQLISPKEFELYTDWFRVSPTGGEGNTSIAITVSLIENASPVESQEGRILIKKGEKEILIPVKFKK